MVLCMLHKVPEMVVMQYLHTLTHLLLKLMEAKRHSALMESKCHGNGNQVDILL